MEKYDPEKTPEPEEWLALDSDQRIILVETYHEEENIESGESGMTVHATMHVVVENQVAENIPAVRNTVGKLTRQGLSRHEAIHAIAAVLTEDIFHLLKGEIESFDIKKYRRRLEKLTAKKWRKGQW